jgi:hypothetical protein
MSTAHRDIQAIIISHPSGAIGPTITDLVPRKFHQSILAELLAAISFPLHSNRYFDSQSFSRLPIKIFLNARFPAVCLNMILLQPRHFSRKNLPDPSYKMAVLEEMEEAAL